MPGRMVRVTSYRHAVTKRLRSLAAVVGRCRQLANERRWRLVICETEDGFQAWSDRRPRAAGEIMLLQVGAALGPARAKILEFNDPA